MIVRDFSPIPYQGGKLPISDLIKAMLQYGFSWPAEMKSQDLVVLYLLRSLDNSHTLLRNVFLPDVEVTIPFILIGPTGVIVINPSPATGIYRAEDNTWATMNKRDDSFRPAKPNLIIRTTLLARAVKTILNEAGFPEMNVDGILILTDPSTHVDAIRPDVRVVLVDGLERFAVQLSTEAPTLDIDVRRKLIFAIENALEVGEQELPLPAEPAGRSLPQTLDTGFDQAVKPLRKKANFSRRQWLILGAFVVAEVVILLIFMLMIIITA